MPGRREAAGRNPTDLGIGSVLFFSSGCGVATLGLSRVTEVQFEACYPGPMRRVSLGGVELAKINGMRNAIAVLIVIGTLCFSDAVSAQVNYDLLPGYGTKRGYPPTVNYRAWVLSYRD